MANTVYENFVLENKLTDILNTKLNVKSLMTIDTDLSENAGMKKTIHKYTYTGAVESVAENEGNTVVGEIGFTSEDYEVGVSQQTFKYTDEQFMKDPMVLDGGMAGSSTLMINDMNDKFFAELQKATVEQAYDTFSYDVCVDAINKMNLEDESGLFLIIGNDLKAVIRKDDDFKSKELGKIIADGAIGTISGVPVIVSKKVPANVAYLATKEAVTLYTKKESEIEQDRDKDKRINYVYMRKVNLVALTDATKVVALLKYIAKPVITTTSIAAGSSKALAGTCVAGATITILKNGAPLVVSNVTQTATVTGTSFSYTIGTATSGDIYSVKASKTNFAASISDEALTVGA